MLWDGGSASVADACCLLWPALIEVDGWRRFRFGHMNCPFAFCCVFMLLRASLPR
jgi:hypothetical protein